MYECFKHRILSSVISILNDSSLGSVTGEQFKGQQRPSPSEPDRLDRTKFGNKEDTGFVENNPRFVQTADNKMRFMTHYMTR